MSIYRSILFVLSLLCGIGAMAACSSEPSAQKEAGTMQLPLQATAPSGNLYQLRSATFTVFQAGATTPTTTLSTSALNDPSTTLTAPLAVGSYTISLGTGWQVIRIDAAGGETAIAASLASANPASFSIVSNQTTNVGFTFNVPGDGSVGFGGNLGVSINVNETGGSAGSGPGTSFLLTAGVSGPAGTTLPGNVQGPGITCNGSAAADCTETIPAGTSVVLTANPSNATGFVFAGWSGAGCSDAAGQVPTTPSITLTMTQNITCIATFAQPQQFSLNVTVSDAAGTAVGSVSGPGIACDSSAAADCSEVFPSGTSVQLTAMGTATMSFTSWSGAGCADASGQNTNPSITLTMSQSIQCTANFGPASASFPPANLPLAAWYSAEPMFITQSASGTGQVSSWADRSGNGRNLTQTTVASQPTFNATGWSASGQGAVIFSGAQHMANTPLGSLFNGTGVPFSVLAVIRMASDTDGAVATFEQAGSTGAFQRARVSDGGPFLRFQATSDSSATFQNDESALLSLTTGNVAAWVNTGTSASLNTDGNPIDSAAHTLGPITTDVFRVGAALTGNQIFLNGRIAELFVVSRAVTPTEYASFRTYARGKWAGLP